MDPGSDTNPPYFDAELELEHAPHAACSPEILHRTPAACEDQDQDRSGDDGSRDAVGHAGCAGASCLPLPSLSAAVGEGTTWSRRVRHFEGGGAGRRGRRLAS
ncbi:hypothetical protein ESCO_003508 [Escovopsis weberi]|uniref:Uncharacterized protein n=1 Tax=Escovopsis weberi TaxID=150374 RepID=A0A0M9VXE4_ESCWE|nr:hypothetical protein ESCO_003508 [Escovopsis weberi]